MFVDVFTAGEAFQGAASYYEQGLACYSTVGTVDLIEVHMWFNLAAMSGEAGAAAARADVASQLTAPEIAEAQRRARIYREGRA